MSLGEAEVYSIHLTKDSQDNTHTNTHLLFNPFFSFETTFKELFLVFQKVGKNSLPKHHNGYMERHVHKMEAIKMMRNKDLKCRNIYVNTYKINYL